MYISKFRVHNYKCFLDSQELVFNPGINVIVGPNDVGKTALLEALSLGFSNVPHINVLEKNRDNLSYVELTISMNKSELRNIIRQTKSRIEIPVPDYIADTYRHGGPIEMSLSKHFEDWLNVEEEIQIRMQIRNGQPQENKRLIFDLYSPPQSDKSKTLVVTVHWQESGSFSSNIEVRQNRTAITQSKGENTQDLNKDIFIIIRNQTHVASATRFSKDRATSAPKPMLQEDGSNLAQVLGSMQSHVNRNRFELFNKIANDLFPAIKRVSVKTLDKNELEMQVWTITDDIELEDYALPISKCGTGYATTLPLVCFMVTPEQKCLLIDEPQAFLHPGAVRKLINKINFYNQHQYFIATHSPIIIIAAKSPTIVQLKRENGSTTGVSLTKDNLADLTKVLESVGARLSDVFGADYVLWVEGPTEEACFPIILETIAKKPLQNIQIVPLANTGDLEVKLSKEQKEKHLRMILNAYRKLSNGYTLLPSAIAFILDTEGKDEEKKKDLKKLSKKELIEFLPLRMYENYLFHWQAIADVINQFDIDQSTYRQNPVTSQEVEDEINKNFDQLMSNEVVEIEVIKKFKPLELIKPYEKKEIKDQHDWLEKVNAGNLLSKIFSKLSDTRVEFSKTTHSIAITKRILELGCHDMLKPISDLLLEKIKQIE